MPDAETGPCVALRQRLPKLLIIELVACLLRLKQLVIHGILPLLRVQLLHDTTQTGKQTKACDYRSSERKRKIGVLYVSDLYLLFSIVELFEDQEVLDELLDSNSLMSKLRHTSQLLHQEVLQASIRLIES